MEREPPAITRLLQFALSVIIGCAVFWMLRDDPDRMWRLIVSVASGVCGTIAILYVVNGLRYGFKSIKGISF